MTIKTNESPATRAFINRLTDRVLGEIGMLAAELGVRDAGTVGNAAISTMVGLSGCIFANLQATGATLSLAEAEERILDGFRKGHAMETKARTSLKGGAS